MFVLKDLLKAERIELDRTVTDWRDGIRAAGALLEKTHSIDSAYTDAMIASVEENGPYIVVAPGFAFAHARPSEAVHETAMSWVRLATPISFGHEKNDPVDLIVALAAQDSTSHNKAMAALAKALGKYRTELNQAQTPEEIQAILEKAAAPKQASSPAPVTAAAAQTTTQDKILTVCGNGLGTSLFLKNTLEQVFDAWGWSPYMTVEATDTISAKGKANEADLILTSGEIARTLGDVGIPVHVINDFTSADEIDAALRELYDI
ncbi:PTS sugar transporter subunit IIA [Corynebacterium crudilactis]|uniref:Ascorbate-specific PTS system EIIA component n=1 Tax=Corynebacterium crudilactis TaxID=1652495 RepID=A0A172QWR4_9CORY|nr:PTS sugar transporter subunit IIA [Corynebacterium crudilactis]ANE05153.1 PTS sugar transporter [Corynebacterium crudilactis]